MHKRATCEKNSGYSNTFIQGQCRYQPNTVMTPSVVRELTCLETRITQHLYAAFSMRNEEWDNNPLTTHLLLQLSDLSYRIKLPTRNLLHTNIALRGVVWEICVTWSHVRGNCLRTHLKLKIPQIFYLHLDAHSGKLPVMCNTKCLYY